MFTADINGVKLTFKTEADLFSPNGIDKGTLAMLSVVGFNNSDKVLDLGCGYGAVGIYAAKLIGDKNIVMSDIDEKSIKLSKENAKINDVNGIEILLSDGFKNIKYNDFSLILSNPPYHSDFSIPKHFIEKGFNRLLLNGRMYMVTKRKTWYQKKMASIFGGVKVIDVDGYYVFYAEKRSMQYVDKSKKL